MARPKKHVDDADDVEGEVASNVTTPNTTEPPVKSKQGFDPSPVPHPADQVEDRQEGDAAKPEGFVHKSDLPPDESESEKAETAAAHGQLFKFSVRNAFVTADGGVRANSAEDAEATVKEWLAAGLEVKEA